MIAPMRSSKIEKYLVPAGFSVLLLLCNMGCGKNFHVVSSDQNTVAPTSRERASTENTDQDQTPPKATSENKSSSNSGSGKEGTLCTLFSPTFKKSASEEKRVDLIAGKKFESAVIFEDDTRSVVIESDEKKVKIEILDKSSKALLASTAQAFEEGQKTSFEVSHKVSGQDFLEIKCVTSAQVQP